MSAQPAPSQDDDNVVEMNDSPGRRLRVARQARGLEVESVAAELHLAPGLIAALERDDYEALPGSVFVIGYMRNYARLLRLDPEPLLDGYRAATRQSAPEQPLAGAYRAGPAGSRHLPVKLLGLALLAAGGALGFAWWQTQSTGVAPGEPMPTEVTASPAEDPASIPGDVGGPPILGQEIQPDSAGAATDAVVDMTRFVDAQGEGARLQPRATDTEPRPVPDPETRALAPTAISLDESSGDPPVAADTGPASPQPNGSSDGPTIAGQGEDAAAQAPQETGAEAVDPTAEAEVIMSFSGPCWVDIRDSDRKFKLFGEMTKGDRHVLEGTPPYSVILGNTAAVSITVAGAPFDLTGIARGNVARFTLDPSELP